MTAETLCRVSSPNCLLLRWYLSLSASDLYHSAVRASPSRNSTCGDHASFPFALSMLAYQSATSQRRFGMEKLGSDLIPNSSRDAAATSAIVIFRPVPMLKLSP